MKSVEIESVWTALPGMIMPINLRALTKRMSGRAPHHRTLIDTCTGTGEREREREREFWTCHDHHTT
jgi:hypothetical protein